MTVPVTAGEARPLLERALQQLGDDWEVVEDCEPVSNADPSHWPSGAQSLRTVLRHRDGRVKVIGRRLVNGSDTTCHRGLSRTVLEAWRDGNTDPMRRYLEEIGVASGAARRVVTGPGRAAFARRQAPAPAAMPATARAERESAVRLFPVAAAHPPAMHRPPTEEPALHGSLAALGLVEVVQAIALGRKTGRLAVTLGTDTGAIVVEGGVPIHAQLGTQSGTDAFVAMLDRAQEGRGSFAFRPVPAIPREEPRTIRESLERLLFSAAFAIDEARAGDSRPAETEESAVPALAV